MKLARKRREAVRDLADVAPLVRAATEWATFRRGVQGVHCVLGSLPPNSRPVLNIDVVFEQDLRWYRFRVPVEPVEWLNATWPKWSLAGLLSRELRAAKEKAAAEAAAGGRDRRKGGGA